ncbi:hypothetical protein [Streptomyces sp. NPDC002054]|uniref:hypothetical protein n=1 Tax=Streptomyces sp. NPDC002054 TaxID=3154663 RepID=UPI00333419E0
MNLRRRAPHHPLELRQGGQAGADAALLLLFRERAEPIKDTVGTLFDRQHHLDGAHPDQHRQRCWNMSTAQRSDLYRRPAEDDAHGRHHLHAVPTRLGKWTFMPRSTGWPRAENATLQYEDLEIDLNYSSSVLEDFLETMRMIQIEFDRRIENTASSTTPVDEHSGRDSRV